VLEVANSAESGSTAASANAHSHGDVLVRSQVVGFKKIKFFTNENIGDGKLELPESEMHTTAYWITLERGLLESLPYSVSERQSGMFGLLHALASVATLLLMCDGRDLGTAIGERPPAPGSRDLPNPCSIATEDHAVPGHAALPRYVDDVVPTRLRDASSDGKQFFEPNLYLYDAFPGGIGFSEPLFRVHDLLVQQTRELISGCPCDFACPSCVGPTGELAPHAKEAALAILDRLIVGGADCCQNHLQKK
jgi:DEAD/DEAH box helicase domain-containing protein